MELTSINVQDTKSYFDEFVSQFEMTSIEDMENIYQILVNRLKNGNKIYVAGNGGSAANANHFASDIMNEIISQKYDIRSKVISLCDSISRVTAIANDYGYENVFSRQLVDICSEDVLVLLSVSGESKNLINALKKAKEVNATVISILSRESTLSRLSDYQIIFGNKDYGISEDFQAIFFHALKRKINNGEAHVYG